MSEVNKLEIDLSNLSLYSKNLLLKIIQDNMWETYYRLDRDYISFGDRKNGEDILKNRDAALEIYKQVSAKIRLINS